MFGHYNHGNPHFATLGVPPAGPPGGRHAEGGEETLRETQV